MNRIEKSHIKSAAITHEGMVGKNNEDRYGVSAFSLQDENETPVLLAVLSDGIGGHRAGEVASEMVVDLISRQVAESDGDSPTRILESAVHYASQEIFSRSQADSGRKGMGATVVCAWVIGQRLYTATVGDSRIYLIRDGHIRQLSTDHSWIQEAIDSGILTPEQAVGHPNAHVIRRYVGSPSPPEVDFRLKLSDEDTVLQAYENQGMLLQNDDQLLLCSDGLTDLVSDEEILAIVSAHPLEESNQILVDLANKRGGHDNTTIIQLKVREDTFKAEKQPMKLPDSARPFAFGCLTVVVLALMVAAAFFGYRWFKDRGGDDLQSTPSEVQQTELPAENDLLPTEPSIKPTHNIIENTSTPHPAVLEEEEESGGNIPPPLEESDATAAPTHTQQPKPSATPEDTATIEPTPTETPGQG